MSFEAVNRRCIHNLLRQDIPMAHNTVGEEVQSQIGVAMRFNQLHAVATCTTICFSLKKG